MSHSSFCNFTHPLSIKKMTVFSCFYHVHHYLLIWQMCNVIKISQITLLWTLSYIFVFQPHLILCLSVPWKLPWMLNKLFKLDPGNATSYDMLVSYISAAFANRELSARAQIQEKKPVVKKQTHDNLCTSFLKLQDSAFSYFFEYICLTFELENWAPPNPWCRKQKAHGSCWKWDHEI